MKRTLILALALVLSCVMAVTGTIAYLSDTDEDVNVMTLGNVDIEQLELQRIDGVKHTGTLTNGQLEDFEQDMPLYPAYPMTDDAYTAEQNDLLYWGPYVTAEGAGNGLFNDDKLAGARDKFVFVKNTGDSDCYYRTWIGLECPEGVDFDANHVTDDVELWANINGSSHFTTSEGEYMVIDGVRYYVFCMTYQAALKPGEISRPSLLQVVLTHNATNEHVEALGGTYEILTLSQAVQTTNFPDAETALNAAFGTPVLANQPFTGIIDRDEAEKEHLKNNPVEFSGVRYATLKDALEVAEQAGGGTIILHADQKLNETTAIPANRNITIDGNGYTISRADGFTGTVLSASSGSTLTLIDTVVDGGAVWTGAIDSTLNRGTTNSGIKATGNLIVGENNSAIVLKSGAILQNNEGAHAVNLGTRIGCTLTIDGGQIINNASDSGAIWGGGNITLNSGKISNNSSTGAAGAIRMVSNCNLTINGGEINNNVAAGDGGAIWGYGASTYTFTGGEMSGNKSAGTGGAIYTGTKSEINISGNFELCNNTADNSGAIRLTDHASLIMTGGTVSGNKQNGESNAFNTWNNAIRLTGGTIADDISYVGGLTLTIGEANISGVISYNLATSHNTAYLAEDFNGFSFKVNETSSNFSQFNFKPADGYTYSAGDEAKLVCLNDGYTTVWHAASGTFRLQAK